MSLIADAEQADDEHDLRAVNIRLLRQLTRAKAKTEDLVEAVHRGVLDALISNPPTPVPAPARDRRKASGEVALWHITDLQGSKVTTSYNSAVMRERVVVSQFERAED